MYKRIFKQKGSRVWRGRYKLGNSPKVYDVALKTPFRHVAEAKLTALVREKEDELAGLIAPKSARDAALKPIAAHLADHLADLTALKRSTKHVAFTRNRITRLCQQCGWKLLRDITADGFMKWRAAQGVTLSPKTLNEYLGHMSAFLTWLGRKGHLSHHPLKSVSKVETRGQERCKRRSLTDDELSRLISSSGRRGLIYHFAACTGLRRGEMVALLWADLHLDVAEPFIEARASTTKNKKTATIPLMPELAQALRDFRAQQRTATGKVFRRGIPKPFTMKKDLKACGIPYMDELGRHVDFHALRHTFDTNLQIAGVSPRAVMDLMRHSDMRLSAKTYTDTTRLPIFQEIKKLPSPIASPKSDKTCLNSGKVGQSEISTVVEKISVLRGEKPLLTAPVQQGPNVKMAEREGFEPPEPFGSPHFECGALDHSATSPAHEGENVELHPQNGSRKFTPFPHCSPSASGRLAFDKLRRQQNRAARLLGIVDARGQAAQGRRPELLGNHPRARHLRAARPPAR